MCVCVCVCVCVQAILSRLHNFLCDVVEEIPAAVGEGGLQKSQSDLSHRRVLTESERLAGLQGVIVTWTKRKTHVDDILKNITE